MIGFTVLKALWKANWAGDEGMHVEAVAIVLRWTRTDGGPGDGGELKTRGGVLRLSQQDLVVWNGREREQAGLTSGDGA